MHLKISVFVHLTGKLSSFQTDWQLVILCVMASYSWGEGNGIWRTEVASHNLEEEGTAFEGPVITVASP
jgi:hypothetical protein